MRLYIDGTGRVLHRFELRYLDGDRELHDRTRVRRSRSRPVTP